MLKKTGLPERTEGILFVLGVRPFANIYFTNYYFFSEALLINSMIFGIASI